MSTGLKISRRRLLLGSLGLGLSLIWRSLNPRQALAESRDSYSARLASLLKHQRSARIVGKEYLRVVPEDGRLDALTSLVVERLPADQRNLSKVTDTQCHELLLREAQRDFHEGRTVVLDGWVLSLTEARLCAIAALCAPFTSPFRCCGLPAEDEHGKQF